MLNFEQTLFLKVIEIVKRKYFFVNGNISCNLVKQGDICYNKKIYYEKKNFRNNNCRKIVVIVEITVVCQNIKVHSTKLKTISNQITELDFFASLKVLEGERSGCMVV